MSKPIKSSGGPDIVYAKNSPLLAQMRKPPLTFVKNQSYGLKLLKRNKELRTSK